MKEILNNPCGGVILGNQPQPLKEGGGKFGIQGVTVTLGRTTIKVSTSWLVLR